MYSNGTALSLHFGRCGTRLKRTSPSTDILIGVPYGIHGTPLPYRTSPQLKQFFVFWKRVVDFSIIILYDSKYVADKQDF